MKLWKIKPEISENQGATSDIHPIIFGLLAQRGISVSDMLDFLSPEYARHIRDPHLFTQMNRVLERLEAAMNREEKVLIFGDYDADGITSTVILKKALDKIGLKPLTYIPDKEKEGYGMNLPAVESFTDQGVKLILTVDCGIANAAEIRRAAELGMDVIVIDHHNILPEIPPAYAIINPKMPDSGYPFAGLAGVGVTFKVVQAIFDRFLPKESEHSKWLLDLVAIGTIADSVPLIDENRILARFGFLVLAKTRNVGLQELFKVGSVRIDENNLPDSHKVAFQVVPRINAASRVDHADLALSLLVEEDIVQAREKALELESKNQYRQKITEEIYREVRIIAENAFKDRNVILAAGEHFPAGILGLVASRVSEEFRKPSIILQQKGGELRGSLRSVPGVDVFELLKACHEQLIKFGGHSQAAGMAVTKANLDAFYEKFERLAGEKLSELDGTVTLDIDTELLPAQIDFHLAGELKKLEPFGMGNPEPIFLMKNLTVQEAKFLGNGEKHLKLFLKAADGSPKIFEAIGFGIAQQNLHLKAGDGIDLAFHLEEDEWNGNKKLQLKIVDLRKVQ